MTDRTVRILSVILFFAVLLWGGLTLFQYLGVEVHDLVFLPGTEQEILNETCGKANLLCRGWNALFPFLGYTVERAAPFLSFALLSAFIYLIFAGWQWVKSGHTHLTFTMKPWQLTLLFLGLTWLLFTVLSNGSFGEHPVRRIYEPLPQVYATVGEEALEDLQRNFQDLQNRGCLTHIGQTGNGAGIYELSGSCIQGAFLTRVLPFFLFVAALLFILLILGRALLRLLKLPCPSPLVEATVSASLGACGFIAVLWTLAVLGILTSPVGWLLVSIIPIALFPHTRYWGRRFLKTSWTVDVRSFDVHVFLAWLLLSYLALNFLSVIRPFPIGWDDLGSYLNRPRLMVSYGHFIFSMSPFQWEYFTSLGFLLFGYNETFGATSSMMINWSAGLLAVLTVFTFARTYLGSGGFLAALLYYALPLVGHFSFADMKIDNAVFAMGALTMFCVFLGLFPPPGDEEGDPVRRERWFVLAGIFGGFAFAMKPTAIMVLMASGSVLLGVSLHWTAFVGAVAAAMLVFVLKGALNFSVLGERLGGWTLAPTLFLTALIVFAFGSSTLALLKGREHLLLTTRRVGLLVLSFGLSVAPWILHNNYLQGNIIPSFQMGAPNTLSPTLAIAGREGINDYGQDIQTLPPELALDASVPACQPTGNKEELDRYWGFRTGWSHYATLPWRSVMNVDSAGYYVTTMPALLLVPLTLFLPFLWRDRGRWVLWLLIGTLFILVQWMLLANGIPWYGIGMFLGFVVLLEVLVARAPDLPNRILASIFVGLSLAMMFHMRFWQFEQQRSILEYPFGKISASALRERTIPHYDNITRLIVERHTVIPNRPYVYRVGTFIPYFIPRNLEIIGAADHQLDTFNCINQEKNHALTLARLKALGFNSIIFDTNTATIERDPNGSLHKKVQAFADFLNDTSLGLQVVVNDPEAGVAFLLIP